MSITKRLFGTTMEGTPVDIYTLQNSKGMKAEIINLGAVIVSLHVIDKDGDFEDIVLGYDDLENYLRPGPYFGAVIGRYANRIENAEFELNGKVYHLYKNNGNNHLHGGKKGFDKAIWNAEVVKQGENESLQLSYRSVDGEENYPGNLDVRVTYTLTEDNALRIDYDAVTDEDTVINLTNHSYFNLSGHASGDITKHLVMLNADKFTPVNEEFIPTGEIKDVKGTPMDFTKLAPVGPGLNTGYEQITFGKGYDHNWVLNVSGKSPEKAAEVFESGSGRVMEVFTTKPGIQFYTGNFLDGSDVGKEGAVYQRRNGLCLETHYFPNSIKHKHFPSPILKAGEQYKHTTIYKFSIRR